MDINMLCVCVRACVCVLFSTLKKIGMKFIPLNLTQPQIFKFPTIANDMEDAQTNVVGTTTALPSIGSRIMHGNKHPINIRLVLTLMCYEIEIKMKVA
jgi:hypothetical protein